MSYCSYDNVAYDLTLTCQMSPLKEGEVSERCSLVGLIESRLWEEGSMYQGPEDDV